MLISFSISRVYHLPHSQVALLGTCKMEIYQQWLHLSSLGSSASRMVASYTVFLYSSSTPLLYSETYWSLLLRLDTCLHNPMYNPISIFTFLVMWYTTAAIPKMLSNLISSRKAISFTGCLLQMYFFHPLGNTEGPLLTVMAIGRYVATSTHSTT